MGSKLAKSRVSVKTEMLSISSWRYSGICLQAIPNDGNINRETVVSIICWHAWDNELISVCKRHMLALNEQLFYGSLIQDNPGEPVLS